MNKWTVLGSEYVYKTPYGNLRRDKCLLPSGFIIEGYHVLEYVDWVNCVAVTKDREIVLERQYRHGAGTFFLETPAGAPKPCEPPEAAIARELREETGYTSDQPPILLSSLYANPSTSNNRVHTYLLTDAALTDRTEFDVSEDIEVVLLPLSEAERAVGDGRISQLFTVCAIELALKELARKGIL